jgi:nitric oxide reductase activation protein
MIQHGLGAAPPLDDLPPAVQAMVREAVAMMDEVASPDATVADSARLTMRIYELIDERGRGRDQPFAPQDGEDARAGADGEREAGTEPRPQPGDGADDYSGADMPPFMTPVLEELMRQAAKEREAQREQAGEEPPPGGELDADKAMQTTEAQLGERDGDDAAQRGRSSQDDAPAAPGEAPDAVSDDQEGGGAEMELGPAGDIPLVQQEAEEAEDLGEHVFYYDEWDHKIEDYRPNWCTLRESRATRTQEGFVAATFHEFGGVVSQIRRNFQLMRPERLRKMRRQPEGDDLDLDGLVDYVVDRRARVSPTERVYVKRDKKDRDVTTVFLVDMSSSTDRKIDGRKRIIDIEKEGLLLMCEALEAIRDEYAIYGFSGSGRDDCQFYVVKELGERYDDRVKGRIGGIYGRQKTRMGPALRHATRRLSAVDSHVKLLILLTDGKPYDSDTYQDNTYAQEDTKMALREARREKIHLFCVTVDREAADYLPHMYSDANFVIIDDVRTLPQKLPQLYRRLTS